ncbi:MAG: SMP-30/gluconolactonase/LRE family protein [Flavobacteriaceae bacterium]|nr:SMP-30/gluconolactonase/LRE family protein [Flavobacteriaceae bacterium]
MKKILFTIIIIQIISCTNPIKDNDSIVVFDDSILNIIDRTAQIEYIVDSLSVAEGPLWDENSGSLLFTQVPKNKIYKWNEEEGYQDYIFPSGFTNYAPVISNIGLSGANGLTFDSDGNLIIAQHGDRRLSKISNSPSTNPNFETIVDNYQGKRFNSPNDVVVSSNGDIFFTDPTYGFMNLSDWSFDESVKELDFSGVYKYRNEFGIELVSNELDLPNGLALSNDERYLYVNSSNTSEAPIILKIDLENNNNSELFFDGTELAKENPGNFDGLKVHSSGNIFTTGPNGILVLSANGKLLANIKFKDVLTNCAFDSAENYLYVTGFSFVARIALKSVI